MGVLRLLRRFVALVFEVNYYIVGSGMLYVALKVAEGHYLARRSGPDRLFAKRLRPPYSLVLDLDETIIRSVRIKSNSSTTSLPITFSNRVLHFRIFKRPHLDTFLMEMRKYYEIVLYSTSQQHHVDAVLNYACINHLFDRKMYRSECVIGSEGVYVKDLTKVRNEVNRVVVIDNSTHTGLLFPDNYIMIDSWFGGQTDTGLLDVMPFLKALCQVHDVRRILGLRCNDHRTYSKLNSSRRLEHDDASSYRTEPYTPVHSAVLSDVAVDWDAIGERLTSRVKQIFDTIGPSENFHGQLSERRPASGANYK